MAAIPAHRRRLYRLLAVALPFLVLVLVEVGLRLAGYGYPTAFFLESVADGKRILTENPRFGWRFFPPALARTPQPMRVSAEKLPGTLRVVVLGESAAMGDPEPAFGFPRQLEVILQSAFPTQKVEVINTAMTAINSHAIRLIAKDCARLNADYWVVYMGNNEVVGPFGAGTVFGPKTPSLGFIRASLWLKNLRVVQALDALKYRLGKAPASWQGMEMFLQQQVRADDRQMKVVRQHFEQNLKDILNSAKQSDAKVIVCSVAVNLKDCAPFASLHRPDLAAADLAEFDKLFKEAETLRMAGSNLVAWEKFQRALLIDRTHAETHFRAGLCRLATGDVGGVIYSISEGPAYSDALRSFRQACAQDTLRFRADFQLNEILRSAAATRTNEGIYWVDADRIFSDASSNRITGSELFWEHVHPNFAGNYLLAKSVAEPMLALAFRAPPLPSLTNSIATTQLSGALQQLAQPANSSHSGKLLMEEVAIRLAWTDWDHFRVADQVRKRLEQPPFTGQSDHDRQMRHLTNLLAHLKPRLAPAALKEQAVIYRAAVTKRPEDWVLRARYGELLETTGDVRGAEEQWRRVTELLPHHPAAYFQLGNLADKQGRAADAIQNFEQALQIQPNLPEALNGLGLCYLNQNRLEEAVAQFQQALACKPDFTAGYVNLALAFSRQGRKAEAQAQYQEAIRIQTNYIAAYLGLGKLLKEQGHTNAALQQYETAVRLESDHPLARLNLASLLGELQRHPEALAHYAAAVQADPYLAAARINYALALARVGRDAEALAQFQAAAEQHPNNGDARLNYGVALARLKRLPEARAEFEAAARLEPNSAIPLVNLGMVLILQNDPRGAIKHLEAALRLDPANAAARNYLERARKLMGE